MRKIKNMLTKMYLELGLTKGRGGFFKLFRGSDDFIMQKSLFIAVNAGLRWLNNGYLVSVYFFNSC
jgi:hypothetical protein